MFLFLTMWGWLAANAQSAPQAASDSSGAFSTAGIGTGTRAISGLWRFHSGDDPAWARPDLDDRGWELLPADQPYTNAAHPCCAGFAWFRREIAIDPGQTEPLALLLPPLHSVAEVFWNGEKVGGVGTPPPHAAWPLSPHSVAVPLPLVPGKHSMVLAIRMWERPTTSLDAVP